MSESEMVIFTRTFDLLAWLLPASSHLPRAHRHSLTRRLLDAAFDLRECLEEANHRKGAARQERLDRADEALARTRLCLRLAVRCGWYSAGHYEHAAEMLVEIGRLFGGWRKATPSIGRTSSMYEELCLWENLLLAWQKACRGKRGKLAAALFEHRLEDRLTELRDPGCRAQLAWIGARTKRMLGA